MAITDEQAAELVTRIDATFQNLVAEGIPKEFVAGEMMARGYAAIFALEMETARGQIVKFLGALNAECAKTLTRAQRRATNDRKSAN
jgi:hypothetical protein